MKILDLFSNKFRDQRGSALMAVLLMVVMLGLNVGITNSTWQTKVRRSKEQELLWRGQQYRKAIANFYQMAHRGAQGTYPRSLEDLKRDPRFLNGVRHIRYLYKDPITGEDFLLIKNAAGYIIGVRSASLHEPFKKDGFPHKFESFANSRRYSEWEFIFKPDDKESP